MHLVRIVEKKNLCEKIKNKNSLWTVIPVRNLVTTNYFQTKFKGTKKKRRITVYRHSGNQCVVKIMRICKIQGFHILLMRKQGIPVYDHYKMFKNRNYNNVSQKRLAKFALIKYRINFRNYGICETKPAAGRPVLKRAGRL